MTVIEVLWLNKGNGDSICRGYWDQHMLGEMFDGKLGRFPHGLTFSHVELNEIPHGDDGAVVVISGRFHTGDESWVTEQIGCLPWCVLIVSGDEESTFNHAAIEHPNLKRWVMTPRPDRMDGLAGAYLLGEGFGPGTREAVAKVGMHADRAWDVGFAGQITHERRTEMAAALKSMIAEGGLTHGGFFHESPGFTQGLDRDGYTAMLCLSRIAPCPAGPATPDSFRIYEALEAGCLPLADAETPEKWWGYWSMVYGQNVSETIPIVLNWSALPEMMPDLLANWQHRANRAGAWWRQTKRAMIHRVADDIAAVSGQEMPVELADLITVVMPTSVIPSHPSTEIVEATIASIRERLPDCTIVIACDGVREEQADRKDDYDEYVRRVVWKAQHEWTNVVPVVAEQHGHQGLTVKMAMQHVRTPMILFCEHDTPLSGDVHWWSCVDAIASEDAHMVRFHHESRVLPEHEHLMVDRDPEHLGTLGDPFMAQRTVQFSARPHLASARWYRDLLDTYFGPTSRAMIEDTLNGVIIGYWQHEGMAGWERHKIWLYAEPNEDGSIQRSDHLDGRGDDPMFPQQFEYPDGGPGPEHAPRAMSHRVD